MPSFAVYGSETDCALMVMPRSRSMGFESSTCASISRASSPPQSWMMRSASVDLPWSTWAMMEKLRMCCIEGRRPEKSAALSHSAPARPVPAWRGRDAMHRFRRRFVPWSVRRTTGLLLGLFLGRRAGGHRHVAAAAAALDEQHRRVARLERGQRAVELGHAVHRGPAHREDDVARLQARTLGREAFDARDGDAFVVRQ